MVKWAGMALRTHSIRIAGLGNLLSGTVFSHATTLVVWGDGTKATLNVSVHFTISSMTIDLGSYVRMLCV